MHRFIHLFVCLTLITLLGTACGGAVSPTVVPTRVALNGRPTLQVSSPVEGALVGVGSNVSVQSTASDARGIVRIELWVDGVLYRMDVTKESDGLPNVSVTQTWPANDLGNHVLLLKAINRDGAASDPTTINISVVPQSTLGSPTPGPTRSAQPTLVSIATPVPVTSTPAPVANTPAPTVCDLDATFVADVTVPDNSTFKPGDTISKVWRVRNSGACAWDAGTMLAFVDGAQMGANNTVPVPLATQGTTVDIAVTMAAPKTAGTYTGKWRLRSGGGKLFGQSVSIVIKVVDAAPPTAAAPAASPTPGVLTAAFSLSRDVIPYGDCSTLKWDVDNAVSVKLDGRGVVGHDTRQVCPTAKTDYTLQVFTAGGGDPIEKELTLTVNPPASGGSSAISVGESVDLDKGQKSVGQASADFLWDAAHSLVPKGTATFARVGTRLFTDVPQDECLNNTGYSNATQSGGLVGAGSMFCYRTDGGKSGKLRIVNSDSDLVMQWVTW
jgi:hypothetical protein